MVSFDSMLLRLFPSLLVRVRKRECGAIACVVRTNDARQQVHFQPDPEERPKLGLVYVSYMGVFFENYESLFAAYRVGCFNIYIYTYIYTYMHKV